MTVEEFEAAAANPAPLYVVDGKDALVSRRAREIAEAQVPVQSRAFNWAVFDLQKLPGQEPINTQKLISTARTLPWMSERRWIWASNADQGGDPLIKYLRDPSEQTVVLLEIRGRVKGWPRLPRISPKAEKIQAREVSERCRAEDFKIDKDVADLLARRCGKDRQLLVNELEKLFLAQWESRRIDLATVQQLTLAAEIPEVFDLIGALAAGQQEKCLRLLHRLYAGGTHPMQILSLLHWNMRRLLVARERLDAGHPFYVIVKELKIWSYKGRERAVRAMSRRFLVAALRELRRTDRLGKSTSLDLRIHLDALVFRLTRGQSASGPGRPLPV